eukprot:TRINITY_DN4922_c0_g1_i1.p1 TRINITY_DN4922_c0_g1~~TRINITY_DN4922_c0_g1_i1.p1  ORF type:complete len:736 (+),score=173.28 TRINITY_DN4922_c0_g1_i1:166-2208(+)
MPPSLICTGQTSRWSRRCRVAATTMAVLAAVCLLAEVTRPSPPSFRSVPSRSLADVAIDGEGSKKELRKALRIEKIVKRDAEDAVIAAEVATAAAEVAENKAYRAVEEATHLPLLDANFSEKTELAPVSFEGEEEEEENLTPKEKEEFDAGKNDGNRFAAAWMLLGSITFIMSLFYLVNWPDKDIRRYAWQTIGNTIAIFAAVLFFQACQSFVVNVVFKDVKDLLIIKFAHATVWFILLQLLIGWISGALRPAPPPIENPDKEVWEIQAPAGHDTAGGIVEEREVIRPDRNSAWGMYYNHGEAGLVRLVKLSEGKEESTELDLACFSGMLAHVAAFSWIASMGHLQHWNFFKDTPLTSFLTVPLGAVVLHSAFVGMSALRHFIATMDGEMSHEEEVWDEVAKECEVDLIGLVCSFLTIQSIRFFVLGVLPSSEGSIDMPDGGVPPFSDSLYVLAVAIVYGLTAFTHLTWYRKNRHTLSPLFDHTIQMFQAWLLMCTAWAFLFAGNSMLMTFEMSHRKPGTAPEEGNVFQQIGLAVLMTVVVFVVILVLDKVADSEHTDDDTDYALVEIIVAMSLATGFSWEQCFDQAVENIAEIVTQSLPQVNKSVVAVTLGVSLCTIVVPAYRYLIFPTVSEHNNLDKKEWEERERAAKEAAEAEAKLAANIVGGGIEMAEKKAMGSRK